MANWQSRLDLTDVWNKYPDEITIQELCKTIVERLRKINSKWFHDIIVEERDRIADEFEIMSTDKELTVEEFDVVMNELYDWGDISIDYKFINWRSNACS